MANTGNTAELITMREQAEEMARAYNEAFQSEDYKSAFEIEEKLKELVNKYTSIVRTACFQACKESADPMLAAIKMLNFMTIAIKDEKVGEEKKTNVRNIIDKPRQIDLVALDKYCGGIGKERNWKHYVQKYNCIMTADCCRKLDAPIDPRTVNDSFVMSDIARAYDMGKNPASNTNRLKTLGMIIAAMIGDEYKPLSRDLVFLDAVYTRKGRQALTVTVASNNQLIKYVAEICHRIVMNKHYMVDYKQKKHDTAGSQFVENNEDKKEGVVTAA